ncbi:Inosine-uridine preferring nucleoside hydrolase [Mycena kentingensis (nom. inval.)]|nr:Inosine-uridine preferring nucleoside hydrolase [Mycena kentingensis (nom. inval.)]
MAPIPVIISTDPGVDDTIAILFALASPELEILAYITCFGNTDSSTAPSHSNILKIYATLARHLEQYPDDASRFPNFRQDVKPILVRGSDGPLQGDLHSAQYFHGRDGLAGISERHPDLTADGHAYLTPSDDSGVDISLKLIESRPPRTITYIALGPLTDLARLMDKAGATVRERIGRIVCMGGALDVPGNTTPVAEFNFFADPFAVKQLLISPSPLLLPLDRFILLPLDVTTPHELPFPAYNTRVDPKFTDSSTPSRAEDKSPLTHFTSAFLEQTRVVMLEFGKDTMELHDIVAVWCATQHPPVLDGVEDAFAPGWKARNRVFDVERFGELTRGFLVVDRREDDQSLYTPGMNRSEAVPALVETEERPKKSVSEGVLCCYETPGPAVLLDALLKRVWGA